MCLLFAFLDPAHEARVAEILRAALPDAFVVASHEVAAEVREFERATTATVDAALGPPTGATSGGCAPRPRRAGLPEPHVMLSSGGVATLEQAAAHPAAMLLSGPAGGAVAARIVASRAGARLRHGRHELRHVLPRRGRRRVRADGRPARRRAAGAAADGRHPHGQRRRRLDRLGRQRRRAAGRAAQRGRRPRTGVLRPRRHRADGDRREPGARAAAGGVADRGRPAARRGRRPRPRSRRSASARPRRRPRAWSR